MTFTNIWDCGLVSLVNSSAESHRSCLYMVLRVGWVLWSDPLFCRTPPSAPGAPTYLDEGESGSWLQGLVFMLHLIGHVLLHPLFLVDLPLMHHVEEGA